MRIVSIETSCDETAVAILETRGNRFFLRTSFIASQSRIHARYGGVVPEVAARAHVTTIIPLLKKALGASIPDAIAVTAGPGLITSLFVGVHTARTLAYIYKKPLIRVNHIEGHIYANWLADAGSKIKNQGYSVDEIEFPVLALIVSGGHTQLILMKGHGNYKIIGETVDDAAGEAFDKVARILELKYPGGPEVSRRAAFGDPAKISLPLPMLHSGDYRFSFSGLKTAVLYLVRDIKKQGHYNEAMRDNICAAFQHSVVSVLTQKTCAAARAHRVRTVLLGGGVAVNTLLRESLTKSILHLHPSPKLVIAPPEYCTDNAAMIAVAALFKAQRKEFTPPLKCDADPAWELS